MEFGSVSRASVKLGWRAYPDDLRFYFQIPEDPDPPPPPSGQDIDF